MAADPVVILSARRTPIGAFQGVFSGTSATHLGTSAVKAALDDAGVDPGAVDEVLMGCVLPAGLGQAPARQAAIGAGIPTSAPCTTVNKRCGSGMKAIMQGYDAIVAGSAEVVVAGGLESISCRRPAAAIGWAIRKFSITCSSTACRTSTKAT